MSIDKTILQYKELNQLQEYAQAQQTTIVQLNKKIQKLEEEKINLKKLLENKIAVAPENLEVSDSSSEEIICRTQLDLLKKISSERELTLEETRKTEVFSKILSSIKSKIKDPDAEQKNKPSEDLIKLVESNDGNKH